MNETTPRAGYSAFVPVFLLSLAFIFLLTIQLVNASRQRSALRNAEQSLRDVEQSRAGMVEQSRAVQADLERLATGLLDLAQTDPEARAWWRSMASGAFPPRLNDAVPPTVPVGPLVSGKETGRGLHRARFAQVSKI